MKSVLKGGILCAGALMMATAVWAQGATNKRIDVKNDWSIFKASNPTECWGASTPKTSVALRQGHQVKVNRGPIMLFVTFRPGAGANGEISFTSGYPFAKGSNAVLDLNGHKYQLFTNGEWAWPRTPADGSGLLAALKGGSKAMITGHSSRGTETQDTFSLMGFTAAMTEAEKACAK